MLEVSDAISPGHGALGAGEISVDLDKLLAGKAVDFHFRVRRCALV
jgi:hypothetical protein